MFHSLGLQDKGHPFGQQAEPHAVDMDQALWDRPWGHISFFRLLADTSDIVAQPQEAFLQCEQSNDNNELSYW